MKKIKIVHFWIVAFSVIIWNTLRGNNWHMIYADFHVGDKPDGQPIRKQLIAKRNSDGFCLYWQDPIKGVAGRQH